MATKTFTASGSAPHLWSDTTKWSGGTLPAEGDTVIIADGTICTIDMDTPNLAYIGTDGVAGTGQCQFSADVTVTFEDMEAGASPQGGGFFALIPNNTITLNGTVKGSSNLEVPFRYGSFNAASGGTINITGDCLGWSGDGARGCFNGSSGTINITGVCIGGSGSDANSCHNNSSGEINITGDCIGGIESNARGCWNNSSGEINITGNCIGGSGSNTDGCRNNSSGAINIMGDCIGGSGGAVSGCRNNSGGVVHIHGKTIGHAETSNSRGVLIAASSTGRVYFHDDLEDGAADAVFNAAGTDAMCYIVRGKKWYDADGNEKAFPDWLEYMTAGRRGLLAGNLMRGKLLKGRLMTSNLL